MKKIFTLAAICAATMTLNAQLIKDDFLSGYTVGNALEKFEYTSTTQGEANPIQANQWNLSGKSGNNDKHPDSTSPLVVAPLTYTGYAASGTDVAIDLLKLTTGGRTTIYSLANDHTYGAGTYYLAFMANVTAAGSANEFLSFDGNYTGNAQRVRYTVKKVDDSETYELGLGDNGAASTFGATALNFGETYLAVIKLTLNENPDSPAEGNGTGTASLYINPTLDAEPGTAFATVNFTGTALKSIRGLVIRQRSSLAAQIGGFRFAKTWNDAIGAGGVNIEGNTTSEAFISASGKTVLTSEAGTLKVTNLSGMEVVNQVTNGSFETALNTGLYIIQFIDNKGNTTTRKVAIK